MSSKRGPTLFELLGDSGRILPARRMESASSSHAPPMPDDDGEQRWWVGAGRTVRVPMGYIFIAAGVVIAALALAYSMGFQSGENRRDRREAALLAAETEGIRDPLVQDSGRDRNASSGGTGVSPSARPEPTRANAPPPAHARDRNASRDGDPRIPGMNYFIVAYSGPELAERTAAFLRDNGVDAAVVPTNTERFRYVISLKPFPAGTMGSPEAREHRALLQRLGRVWKRDHNAPDDFSQIWAQKYTPPDDTNARRADADDNR